MIIHFLNIFRTSLEINNSDVFSFPTTFQYLYISIISHENIFFHSCFLTPPPENSIKTRLEWIWRKVFISKEHFFISYKYLIKCFWGVTLWIRMKVCFEKPDNAYNFCEIKLQTVEIVKNNYHTFRNYGKINFCVYNTITF